MLSQYDYSIRSYVGGVVRVGEFMNIPRTFKCPELVKVDKSELVQYRVYFNIINNQYDNLPLIMIFNKRRKQKITKP